MVLLKTVPLIKLFIYVLFLNENTKSVKIIHKLPSYFPRCHREDPEINKCLLKATNEVRPYMIKGVPELRIPAFEPFTFPRISFDHDGSRLLNFKAVLTDLVAHGLTNYEFTKYEFDVPTLQVFCDMKVPKLQFVGNFTMDGRILSTPLKGGGIFRSTIGTSFLSIKQQYEFQTKSDGKVYIHPTSTNATVKVTDPEAHLEGLFGESKQLDEALNQVIKDNVNELFEELRPVVERTVMETIHSLTSNAIMKFIPYEDLF